MKTNYFEELETLLLEEHSKVQRDLIINYIGEDQEKLNALAYHFLGDDYRLAQRAAWPIGVIGIKNPNRILPYLKDALLNAKHKHDAVKRNTIRILSEFKEIPISIESEAMNVCFDLLAKPKEAIAIKVFSMTVLFTLSKKYPEIQPELKILIEEQIPTGSAGFKNRGQKILKKLA